MHKYKTHVETKERIQAGRPVESLVAELIQTVYRDHSKPVIIAVGGPGGTGKTTFSGKLADHLEDAAVLNLDHYKTPRQDRVESKLYGSHPDANHMALIHEHLASIRSGKLFESPVYNDTTGIADTQQSYHPKRFNVLDGEISVYREFRDLIDFTIFIDSDWKTQLNTRLFRDIQDRGYSREKVIQIFLQSNLKDFEQYGAEAKNWADVHLYCESDYRITVESVSKELYERFENLFSTDLKTVDLSGLIVPILTPFDDQGGIYREKFIEHLEFLAHHGVHRILVCGTTGEFFSLTSEEKRLLLRLTRSYFPGVILYLAGAESLVGTLEQIQWAEEDGADAVLVLPHYYLSGLSAQNLAVYLTRISEKTSLPLILYNFPKYTGNSLTPEILSQVTHFGVKDSSANLDLLSHTPNYFMGGDSKILESHRLGGKGFFSARANVFPALFMEMEKALRFDPKEAKTIQQKIKTLSGKMGRGHEIPELKAVMPLSVPGYPVSPRLPLLAVSDADREKLQTAVKALK
ncbi:dihydrodipicolinate synthase family protein [candidate division KSB1 bacterium]|nr:dihydrodipicolinate synthase family protein [candidate division KSB1 bacterium]